MALIMRSPSASGSAMDEPLERFLAALRSERDLSPSGLPAAWAPEASSTTSTRPWSSAPFEFVPSSDDFAPTWPPVASTSTEPPRSLAPLTWSIGPGLPPYRPPSPQPPLAPRCDGCANVRSIRTRKSSCGQEQTACDIVVVAGESRCARCAQFGLDCTWHQSTGVPAPAPPIDSAPPRRADKPAKPPKFRAACDDCHARRVRVRSRAP